MSCYHSFLFSGTTEELQAEFEQIGAAGCSIDLYKEDRSQSRIVVAQIGYWSNELPHSSIHNFTGADLAIMAAQGD